MKSPKVKGIGEVVTEYGAKVMKIFKKGLLGRSLFDFYGDVKAQTFRTKESASSPSTPTDGAGGIMYTKSADGKLYYKSNEVSEVEISAPDTNTVYSEATGSAEGLMSTAHHDKLDGIETGATADQTKSDINGLAITTVGTIGTGVWQGTAIASANLDADTAHLSGVQTFLGPRTFAAGIIYDGDRSTTPGDGAAIHVDASDITDNNTSASGTATAFRHVNIENPRILASNASVTTTDASTVYIKGAPVASTNQTITNAYALEVAAGSVKLGAGLEVGGDLDVTGNVLPGITYVKILPSDFMPDDGGRPAMIDDTGSDRWLESHGTLKLFAFVEIPLGFKATHVHIYGSATSAITVYEADVDSKTVTSKGTGNIGTDLNITDVTADATNYIMIELAQASGEEVYGGKMTIAKA